MINNTNIVMGIETSCDETSIAIMEGGNKLLSNIISSQMEIHEKYGGIVPEIASRKHMELIMITCKEALEQANINLTDVNGIAVVPGPGLKGSLLVGLSFGKAIAYALKKPLIGVNHIEGHIFANFINNNKIEYPFISLIVSGGHTLLMLVDNIGKYRIIGSTRDDAAGEVLDKISKYLNLGYPGGPVIERLAETGRESSIYFPRPLFYSNDYDFSFSGLKTAVINFVINKNMLREKININNLCASFQMAIIDTLKHKAISAARKFNIPRIVLGGGVTANQKLRNELLKEASKYGIEIFYPPKDLCTDNGAMIACAGYHKLKAGLIETFDLEVFTK